MTMTPYELRFELLQFARDNLTNKYHAEVQRAMDLSSTVPASRDYPTWPTDQRVFDLANEYKKFVDTP